MVDPNVRSRDSTRLTAKRSLAWPLIDLTK
jgi:hypothetical protein